MQVRKMLSIMTAISAMFALMFVAQAGAFSGHRMSRGGGPDLKGLHLFLELKLTEAQQAEMSRILANYREAKKALKGGFKDARKKVSEALRQEPFDEAAARNAFREASAAKEQKFMLKAKTMAELKALLTPEQLATLKEHKACPFDKKGKKRGS